jgi:hypothetical protein
MDSSYKDKHPLTGYSFDRQRAPSGGLRVVIPYKTIKTLKALPFYGVMLGAMVTAGIHLSSRQAAPAALDNTIAATASAPARAPEEPLKIIVRYGDGDEAAQASAVTRLVKDTRAFFKPATALPKVSDEAKVKAFYQAFPDFKPETAKWLLSLMQKLNVHSDAGPIIAGVDGMWKNGKCDEKGQSAFGLFQFKQGSSWVSYLGGLKVADPDFLRRAFEAAPPSKTSSGLKAVLDAIEIDAHGQWAVKKGKESLVEHSRKDQTINAIVGLWSVEKDGPAKSPGQKWLRHILGERRSSALIAIDAMTPQARLDSLQNEDGSRLISNNEIKANGMFRKYSTVAELFDYSDVKTQQAEAWKLAMISPKPKELHAGHVKLAVLDRTKGKAVDRSRRGLVTQNSPKSKFSSKPSRPTRMMASTGAARNHTQS